MRTSLTHIGRRKLWKTFCVSQTVHSLFFFVKHKVTSLLTLVVVLGLRHWHMGLKRAHMRNSNFSLELKPVKKLNEKKTIHCRSFPSGSALFSHVNEPEYTAERNQFFSAVGSFFHSSPPFCIIF